jgi:serine/threonine protein phosphatase 1
MKYFIVSDVHSCFNELKEALDTAGFDINNDEHMFVSCGDLLDRGQQPLECLRFVLSIPKHRRKFIYGNHEELMQNMIAVNYAYISDFRNGTAQTIQYSMACEFNEINDNIRKFAALPEWKKYIKECVDYFEIGNYICVHGWIPCEEKYDKYRLWKDDWKNHSFRNARWYNGMNAWKDGVRLPGKTIVCGHVCAEYGHIYIHQDENCDRTQPFMDEGIVALDSRVFRTGRLNCFVIEL